MDFYWIYPLDIRPVETLEMMTSMKLALVGELTEKLSRNHSVTGLYDQAYSSNYQEHTEMRK